MLKPICVKCHRFFRQIKSGFYFIEGMPGPGEGMPGPGGRAEPGMATPERWVPYKLWSGDKWKCEGCGAEIISGTALNPIREHYHADFQKRVNELGAEFQVNDC